MPIWCHLDGRPYSACGEAWKTLDCGIRTIRGLSAERAAGRKVVWWWRRGDRCVGASGEIDCLNHEAIESGYLLGMYRVLLGIGIVGVGLD
jgi:hypothetical protein